MEANEVVKTIRKHVDKVNIINKRYVFASTDKKKYKDALSALKERGIQHVSTISGIDRGETITIVYHIDCRPALLNLKLDLPKSEPEVSTITDIFPGAILYERELAEMLGVKVEGHPEPRKLFLPDDWPSDVYPLRKGVKL